MNERKTKRLFKYYFFANESAFTFFSFLSSLTHPEFAVSYLCLVNFWLFPFKMCPQLFSTSFEVQTKCRCQEGERERESQVRVTLIFICVLNGPFVSLVPTQSLVAINKNVKQVLKTIESFNFYSIVSLACLSWHRKSTKLQINYNRDME